MGYRRTQWCAADGWSVGATSGSGIVGRVASVVRWTPAFSAYYKRRGMSATLRRGEADGLRFALSDAGSAAYDRELAMRGYLVPYRRKSFWIREQFEARARSRGRIS